MRSKVLQKKTSEEILSPSPEVLEVKPSPAGFTHAGQTYKIYPMPDGVAMGLTDAISQIVAIIFRLRPKRSDDALEDHAPEAAQPETPAEAAQAYLRQLKIEDIVGEIDPIVRILLPNATKLIAASLRQDEQWVQDNLFFHDRLRAVKCILKAEDTALWLGELSGLMDLFQAAPEATNDETPASETTEAGD